MNIVILVGRVTADPQIRWSAGEKAMCVARYSIAVPRKYPKQDETDFINCVVFGKSAEFAEKYIKKGTKLAITGSIKTGSYTNKEGKKVYTTEVSVTDQEFAESKAVSQQYQQSAPQSQMNTAPQMAPQPVPQQNFGYQQNSPQNYQKQIAPQQQSFDGFMQIPDGITEEMPFM